MRQVCVFFLMSSSSNLFDSADHFLTPPAPVSPGGGPTSTGMRLGSWDDVPGLGAERHGLLASLMQPSVTECSHQRSPFLGAGSICVCPCRCCVCVSGWRCPSRQKRRVGNFVVCRSMPCDRKFLLEESAPAFARGPHKRRAHCHGAVRRNQGSVWLGVLEAPLKREEDWVRLAVQRQGPVSTAAE